MADAPARPWPRPRVPVATANAAGFASRPIATALAALALLAATASTGVRVWNNLNVAGAPEREEYVGLQDFRDALYYPSLAFLRGENPYDAPSYRAHHPVGNRFPLYGPVTLLVHWPFALLPFEASEAIFFAFTLGLVLVLARLALFAVDLPATPASVMAVGAWIICSRPGHQNLFLGQTTAELALATSVALLFARDRPFLAGVGIALATIKPTYAVPLVACLLAARAWRAVLAGALVAGTATLGTLAILAHAAGSPAALLESMLANHADFNTVRSVNPVTSPFRIDAVALVGRVTGAPVDAPIEVAITLTLMTLGARGIVRLATLPASRERDLLAFTLATLTILVSTYHQSYDTLLLVIPLAALVVGRVAAAPPTRWALLVLAAVPAVNYLSADTSVDFLGLEGSLVAAIFSINGAALLLAFAVAFVAAVAAPARLARAA